MTALSSFTKVSMNLPVQAALPFAPLIYAKDASQLAEQVSGKCSIRAWGVVSSRPVSESWLRHPSLSLHGASDGLLPMQSGHSAQLEGCLQPFCTRRTPALHGRPTHASSTVLLQEEMIPLSSMSRVTREGLPLQEGRQQFA